MSWIAYSLFALIMMTVFNLSQKWALNKISVERYLFYVFFGYTVCGYTIAYFLTDLPRKIGGLVDSGGVWRILLWGAIAAAFSIGGNLWSSRAYNNASNPGYVEGVKSSNAILTTFLAFIFLGAPLVWQKLPGMVFIALGLLGFRSEKTKKKVVKPWFWQAITGGIFLSLMMAVIKLITQLLQNFQGKNEPLIPIEALLALVPFATIGFLILGLRTKAPWRFPLIAWVPVILSILIGIAANWFNFTAIFLYKNPGAPQAILNVQGLTTLVLAALVFPKDRGGDFSWKKWLGVMAVLAGLLWLIFVG